MINLKLLTKGLKGVLTPSEFITLYVIETALGKNNEWKKLYYDMMADLTNLSTKQVKRNVDSLIEKGFICRQTRFESSKKRVCLYCLNLDKNVSKNTSKVDKNVSKNSTSLDTGVLINNLNLLKTIENDMTVCNTVSSKQHEQLEDKYKLPF